MCSYRERRHLTNFIRAFIALSIQQFTMYNVLNVNVQALASLTLCKSLSWRRRFCHSLRLLAHRPRNISNGNLWSKLIKKTVSLLLFRARIWNDGSGLEGNSHGSWARLRSTHEHERSALRRCYATDSRVAERQLSQGKSTVAALCKHLFACLASNFAVTQFS